MTGVGKLWRHSPQGCHEFGMVNKLYEMLRDTESTVVTFSLQTLNVILSEEGGVKVNKKMVRYFLTRIVNYKAKEFCFLADFLAIPVMDEDLRIQTLNVLDPFLDQKDGNIVLSTAKLLTKIVKNQPILRKSLINRLVPVFCGFLKSGSYRDFNPILIDFLSKLDEDYIYPFISNHKYFFLKSKDSEKLSLKKISFIDKLVTEDNSVEVLNYLFNLLPQSSKLNSCIFSTAARISVKDTSSYIHCISNLELILKADSDKHVCDILDIVKVLDPVSHRSLDEEKVFTFVRTVLSSTSPLSNLNPKRITSLLYLLNSFCGYVSNSPYYIEDILLIEDKSSWSPILYSQLLSCAVNVFNIYPASMQITLGHIFQLILQQKNHDLQERAVIYYNLLYSESES